MIFSKGYRCSCAFVCVRLVWQCCKAFTRSTIRWRCFHKCVFRLYADLLVTTHQVPALASFQLRGVLCFCTYSRALLPVIAQLSHSPRSMRAFGGSWRSTAPVASRDSTSSLCRTALTMWCNICRTSSRPPGQSWKRRWRWRRTRRRGGVAPSARRARRCGRPARSVPASCRARTLWWRRRSFGKRRRLSVNGIRLCPWHLVLWVSLKFPFDCLPKQNEHNVWFLSSLSLALLIHSALPHPKRRLDWGRHKMFISQVLSMEIMELCSSLWRRRSLLGHSHLNFVPRLERFDANCFVCVCVPFGATPWLVSFDRIRMLRASSIFLLCSQHYGTQVDAVHIHAGEGCTSKRDRSELDITGRMTTSFLLLSSSIFYSKHPGALVWKRRIILRCTSSSEIEEIAIAYVV